MALLEKEVPRQTAYELVQGPALRAWEEERSFEQLVREDGNILAYLNPEELRDIFDAGQYLRYEREILDRVFSS